MNRGEMPSDFYEACDQIDDLRGDISEYKSEIATLKAQLAAVKAHWDGDTYVGFDAEMARILSTTPDALETDDNHRRKMMYCKCGNPAKVGERCFVCFEASRSLTTDQRIAQLEAERDSIADAADKALGQLEAERDDLFQNVCTLEDIRGTLNRRAVEAEAEVVSLEKRTASYCKLYSEAGTERDKYRGLLGEIEQMRHDFLHDQAAIPSNWLSDILNRIDQPYTCQGCVDRDLVLGEIESLSEHYRPMMRSFVFEFDIILAKRPAPVGEKEGE